MRKTNKYFELLVLRHCSSYILRQYILLDQIENGESEVKKTLWKFLNILGEMEIKNEKNCIN